MKPDWATRLQRTFARKYDAGFAKGLMLGKAVGARDEQERIIEQIETLRCPENGIEHDCLDELGGYTVNDLIALIKGEK